MTDDTARAILDWKFTNGVECEFGPANDLQPAVSLLPMAKLWLLKSEIERCLGDNVPVKACDDLLAKLRELDSPMTVMTFCKHGFQDGDKCPVCKGVPQFSDVGAVTGKLREIK